MQDNLQARKCKVPIDRLKKFTIYTKSEGHQYQDWQYNSDDQYSDVEDAAYVEAYNENELD